MTVSFLHFLDGNSEQAGSGEFWPVGLVGRRPATASTLALFRAEAGRLDDARQLLGRFEHREHLRSETSTYSGYGWAAALATRAMLGDTDEVGDLYQRLSLLKGRQIIPGPGAFFLLPADYYLGIGAMSLAEHDRANEHFETATRWAEQVGSIQTMERIERIT